MKILRSLALIGFSTLVFSCGDSQFPFVVKLLVPATFDPDLDSDSDPTTTSIFSPVTMLVNIPALNDPDNPSAQYRPAKEYWGVSTNSGGKAYIDAAVTHSGEYSSVVFDTVGQYTLTYTGVDGDYSSSDDITITVN